MNKQDTVLGYYLSHGDSLPEFDHQINNKKKKKVLYQKKVYANKVEYIPNVLDTIVEKVYKDILPSTPKLEEQVCTIQDIVPFDNNEPVVADIPTVQEETMTLIPRLRGTEVKTIKVSELEHNLRGSKGMVRPVVEPQPPIERIKRIEGMPQGQLRGSFTGQFVPAPTPIPKLKTPNLRGSMRGEL